jgi:hypothetical protein
MMTAILVQLFTMGEGLDHTEDKHNTQIVIEFPRWFAPDSFSPCTFYDLLRDDAPGACNCHGGIGENF